MGRQTTERQITQSTDALEHPMAMFQQMSLGPSTPTMGMGLGMTMGPTLGMQEGMPGLPHPLDVPQAYVAPILGTPAGTGMGLAFAGSPASTLMAKTAISP